MTVLRIVPTGDGKTHDVHRDWQGIGQVVKPLSAGEPPWTFRLYDEVGISNSRWDSRSGAAVALATALDEREARR